MSESHGLLEKIVAIKCGALNCVTFHLDIIIIVMIPKRNRHQFLPVSIKDYT